MSLDLPRSPAEQLLLAELDRRAAPTRAKAKDALWEYGSVEDLVLCMGRWYLATVAPVPAVGFSAVVTQARERRGTYVEGFQFDIDYRVLPAAWVATGDLVMAGTGGMAFLGVPLRLDFVDTVRRRSGAASVLHGQQLDRWRRLEFGLPRTAVSA